MSDARSARQPQPKPPTNHAQQGSPPQATNANQAAGEGRPVEPTAGAPSQDGESLFRLVVELATRRDRVASANPELGRDLDRILATASTTPSHADPTLRQSAAFLVQDVEKALRERINIAPETRNELTTLAGTAPGLTNDRMAALLRSTAAILDRRLVQEIRQTANEIAREPRQDAPAITSAIDVLESRGRLAPRADPIPDSPGAAREAATTGSQQHSPRIERPTAPIEETPGGGSGRGPQQTNQQQPANVTIHRSAIDVLLGGLRGAIAGATDIPGPLDAPHTPMAGRLAAAEARVQGEKEDRLLTRVEARGHAAIEALQGFQIGAAASIITRINDAARNNPGGLEAVLSEMRPGGQFADLRTQFNAALNTDHAVSAAYDKAAAVLAQYGKDRPALDAIIAKRPDATNLNAKFESLDAQIGEAASSAPSRHEGKSMIEDLSRQIADLLMSAVDRVRAAFTRTPTPGATANPSPSPGMSP